jgi:hypothetical protein
LAERTGWSEAAILALDEERLAGYIEKHNELVEEQEERSR